MSPTRGVRSSLRRKPRRLRDGAIALALWLLGACGSGGGGSPSGAPPVPSGSAAINSLTAADVALVLEQGVLEAQAHQSNASIAVVDRVGNLLGLFNMSGTATSFTITDGRAVTGGLDNVSLAGASLASVSEAMTAAYLSSDGNAFSTRTASQIIQENFNPGETDQPSGPLFGVQFSQFSCSEIMQSSSSTEGPHGSPLGLSGSPGGLPLYKDGVLVGGVGVIADASYTIDRNILDIAPSLNELIAVAASTGYAAPVSIRANRITAGGRSLRYVNSEAILSNPADHASLASLPGTLVTGPLAGVAYGTPASGLRADTGTFAALGAFTLVNASNQPRFAPRGGSDGFLTEAEVTEILTSALKVASHTRAQIRQPLNTTAQVSITVVDTQGVVLGFTRSADAPIFGIDVALQKARTAMFFSQPSAAAQLAALPTFNYFDGTAVSIGSYIGAAQSFFGNPAAFADGTAYSARAIGNLSRPFFPDGINGNPPGPLSKPFSSWSVFSDGLQLDLVNQFLLGQATSCTGIAQLANGIQIFPGGVPIYRGNQLVGAIGVSGDGVDQDDMVAFLGLANAGKTLASGVANAPPGIRADNIVPPGTGTNLLYVQCPQAPFTDSDAQDVCNGL